MVPEYVIVTLQTHSGSFLDDFRVPSKITVEKLILLLKQALQEKMDTSVSLQLCLQGYLLSEENTLADYGIWDGSILTVKEAEQ